MLAAVLTTLLFSVSAIFGRRVSQYLSATQANLARLTVAATFLGLWSHLFGFGLQGPAFPVLLLSGCVGFGLGDLAMFQAYQCIGARRTVVLIQCLAAPFGTVAEWLWLGRAPTLLQATYGCVILAGVGIALAPAEVHLTQRQGVQIGVCFGILAAVGQAGGAVLSRKAYAVASAAGQPFRPILSDGVNAAYQRMLGGIAVSIAFFIYLKLARQTDPVSGVDGKRAWRWVVAHALIGSAAGVTCFQWALMLKPANIVLPIVATTPLVVLPIAHFFEGERMTRRTVLGSAVAVAGVVGLVQVT